MSKKKKAALWSTHRLVKFLQKGNPSRSKDTVEYAIKKALSEAQIKGLKRVGMLRFFTPDDVRKINAAMIENETTNMGRPRKVK
jgi:hypothetical protein